VAGDRRLRILTQLVGRGAFGLETKRLCEVCAEVTGMSGAGIMLMSGELPEGVICTTDQVSKLIEDLQFTLGEGPCVDAFNHDRPTLEPDLTKPEVPRWMAFSIPAIAAGVRAVFGFPLQVGAVRLGALNLYRDEPGPLSDDQHADALVMADVSAAAVLMMQANAPPGKLAVELEQGAEFRYVVHQAAGMVAAQLDVSIAQAMIRLRGYSFSNDRPLTEVALDVVARRLRFNALSGEKDPGP
jgi:GAF domain-containing protein